MKRLKPIGFVIILFSCFSSGCQSLKTSERIYLIDPSMQIGQNDAFNKYVFSIREGGMPTGGTSSSGGCGCK